MRLHSCWIFGFRQNFQYLIVGQKEKSRQKYAFLFQKCVQALLDALEMLQ